jgi:hypothetical protein
LSERIEGMIPVRKEALTAKENLYKLFENRTYPLLSVVVHPHRLFDRGDVAKNRC